MSFVKAIFLSDSHFRRPEDLQVQKLIKFLKQHQGRQHLSHIFLVGDIFDMWIANYSYFIDRWLPLNSELLRLKQAGVEIHYFEGNHDLYLSYYFGEQLGFKIHKGPANLKLGAEYFRIEHGDQMDPSDYGYRLLRWFWRTPLMNYLAPRLPGVTIGKMGEELSSMSRKRREYNPESQKKYLERLHEMVVRHVNKVADEEFPFQYFISGHIHQKMNFNIETSRGSVRVLNLGTWVDSESPECLVYDGKSCIFEKVVSF